MKLAMLVAERSTCLRHHVGAVIVRDKSAYLRPDTTAPPRRERLPGAWMPEKRTEDPLRPAPRDMQGNTRGTERDNSGRAPRDKHQEFHDLLHAFTVHTVREDAGQRRDIALRYAAPNTRIRPQKLSLKKLKLNMKRSRNARPLRSQSSPNLYKPGRIFVGRLNHKDDLLAGITSLCKKQKIHCGYISVIGAVRECQPWLLRPD